MTRPATAEVRRQIWFRKAATAALVPLGSHGQARALNGTERAVASIIVDMVFAAGDDHAEVATTMAVLSMAAEESGRARPAHVGVPAVIEVVATLQLAGVVVADCGPAGYVRIRLVEPGGHPNGDYETRSR